MSDAPVATRRPTRGKSRVWSTLKAVLRTRVTAGLITILPIYVTFVVVRFVFDLMRDASHWVISGVFRGEWIRWLPASWGIEQAGYTDEQLGSSGWQWIIAITSVLFTFCFLYVIGLFAANIIGHRFLSLFERFIDNVPLAKTIYHASKQILASFSGGADKASQRVALVPFPTHAMRSLGFITSTSRDTLTGEELCTVFIATTPNPTSGFVFVLKRADVVELDWSVEDAVKVLISGGILMPPAMAFPADPAHAASPTIGGRDAPASAPPGPAPARAAAS